MLKSTAAPAAAIIVAATLLVSCSAENADTAPASTAAAPDLAPAAEAAAYPDTYRSLDLPVLPGGLVTSSGRQSTSLRDGLSIRLTTDQSVAEARTFYTDHMNSLGWTSAPSGPGAAALNLPVANVAFTRGQLTFQATITAADTGSLVAITVVER